ncbi:MAG TPA: penicillin acylase family protein [Myxococcales bacterium]|jgi:penicillin amidase
MRFLLRLLGSRLPRTEGRLGAPVRSEVAIRRDRHGIVYVEARDDDDAFFGLGFAEAQDRAFQLELFVRAARGTLSELVGAEMLDADRLARRLGFLRNARAQVGRLPAAARAQLEAFARGVNFAVRQGPRTHESVLLGAPPFVLEPADSLAVVQFIAFALCSNWDAELARLRVLLADGPEALIAIEAADPALLATEEGSRLERDARLLQAADALASEAGQLLRVGPSAGASNNWVLAPSRTTTGRPLLACDPHLSPMLPAYWYLAHVRTPEWAMSGAFFPGQPVASFGHNETVAWGFTAGHHDNTDLFVERLSDDGTKAFREGRWEGCEVRDEVIRVRGRPDVHERVVVTARGPIVTPCLSTGGPALSMRATWMAPRPFTSYQLFRAATVAEAREFFRSYPGDSENRLFADVNGTIAWQLVGDAPVRRGGHGLVPMPAWHGDAGWESEPLPFESMPGVTDPPEGFLATANQAPAAPTPSFLGADWLDGGRHARVVELLATKEKWDLESAMRMQLDRTTVYWKALREKVLSAVRGSAATQAVALLEAWDGAVDPGSTAASVYELWFAELMCRVCRAKAPRAWRAALGEGLNALLPHGMMGLRRSAQLVRLVQSQPDGWFDGGWPAEIRASLDAAVARLERAAGRDPKRWAWGKVRPLVLTHPVGTKPVLGSLFNLGPIAFGGDGSTIPQASVPFDEPLANPIGVPNLRMVLDVGNWEASRWVLAGGQSGNPLSAHYGDLLPIWERGEGVPIAWSKESVAEAAREQLTLAPTRG